MAVQIGASTHGFSDPLGLLSDCHRRIEMFLEHLDIAGKTMERPITPEVEQLLHTALKYFREAAPRHTADEEESLFPRLRNTASQKASPVLARLGTLEEEHRVSAPLHAEVERLGTMYLARGTLSPADVESFRTAVAGLRALYREHIQIEDGEVFPIASTLLSASDRAAIGEEMAARRKVA